MQGADFRGHTGSKKHFIQLQRAAAFTGQLPAFFADCFCDNTFWLSKP